MQADPLLTIKTATLTGNKAEAVRLYQQHFGANLAQATLSVDQLERELIQVGTSPVAGPVFSSSLTLPVTPEVLVRLQACLQNGDTAGAVLIYRESTGVSEAEARAAVDLLDAELRLLTPTAPLLQRSEVSSLIGLVSGIILILIVAYSISRYLH